MRLRKQLTLIGATASIASVGIFGGVASAAFPNFSDCPRGTPSIAGCINIQSTNGSMTIKGFTVPIGTSFEIRGAIRALPARLPEFVAPAGTTGLFAKPIQVPGGILGIDFPIPGNAVTATTQLAGVPSDIHIDTTTLTVSMPLKLKLTNPLIGSGCYIGSDSNPVNVRLIVGRTSPPPPNVPISGAPGVPSFQTDGTVSWLQFVGNRNVDNSFAIPGASGCGINLGLINALINAKLKLPSAAGNNSLIVENNVAVGGLN